MFFYTARSSQLDRAKRFTLILPWQTQASNLGSLRARHFLKIIGGHRGQYAGHQGHWYFKQNIKLMQYTQACIYTFNVCYPIIGAYAYMYTGTLDKINTSAISVRNSACPLVRVKWLFTRTSKQSISSSVDKWKVTTIFYLPLKLQQSAPQLMTHRTNTAKFTPKWYIITFCLWGPWTEPVTLLHSTLMSSQQKPDCVLF